MNYPLVSIIIATYNSDKSLTKVLEAIKKQNYPKNKIEILIIDGGSKDETLEIAKKFKCKVIKNSQVDQVYGKFIGYKKAKGKLMLLIDSDEVMSNKNSIKLKTLSILENKNVNVAISTGLAKPESYPEINYYLNEFGDPFSYFMYRNSKDPKFFLKQLKLKYKIVKEDKDKVIFDFSQSKEPPFIELTAMSVMVNRDYIKKNFPDIFSKVSEHTHLFYLLNSKKNFFAVMKHDPVIHYSVSSLTGYLRKIRSRITSNIFVTKMGVAGFSGRETYHTNWYKFKKYLFIFYALTLIWPIADSIYLSFTRKKLIYLIHSFLSIYTACLILFFYLKKILGIETKLYNYGGK